MILAATRAANLTIIADTALGFAVLSCLLVHCPPHRTAFVHLYIMKGMHDMRIPKYADL